MTKSPSIVTGLIAVCLVCLGQTAWAQGWSQAAPPWRGPSAASRSTTPTSAAGPFNAYNPAYGSYPDPVEREWTANPQGMPAGHGGSAYSKYTRNPNRLATGYAGETLYYGGESFVQPATAPPAEQVLPPGTALPMQEIPAPLESISPPGMSLQSAPSPLMMHGPSGPSDPCEQGNPCGPNDPCGASDPGCPPSWQHRCGQRLGEMLAKMRECCDKLCACLENCCPKSQCCWSGYQAWWHAPQPSNCMFNEVYPSDQGVEAGVPLDMELASPEAEVIDGTLSESYETVEPTTEVVEEGPSFIEHRGPTIEEAYNAWKARKWLSSLSESGRPTIEDASVTRPENPLTNMPQVSHTSAAATGHVEASGHVENGTTAPVAEPTSTPIEDDAADLPTLELVAPAQDDSTT
jgi:hypothetical protein